jgi:hypothetical protein
MDGCREGGRGVGGLLRVSSKVGGARLAGRSGGAASGCGIVSWPRLALFRCQVSTLILLVMILTN